MHRNNEGRYWVGMYLESGDWAHCPCSHSLQKFQHILLEQLKSGLFSSVHSGNKVILIEVTQHTQVFTTCHHHLITSYIHKAVTPRKARSHITKQKNIVLFVIVSLPIKELI